MVCYDPLEALLEKESKDLIGVRHQAHSKADKEKRRQRFLNKRNCLTMVGLYYFSLSYSNALDQKKRARLLGIRMWIHFSREESGFNTKCLTVKLHEMLAG